MTEEKTLTFKLRKFSYELPLERVFAWEHRSSQSIKDVTSFNNEGAAEILSQCDNKGSYERGFVQGQVFEVQYGARDIYCDICETINTSRTVDVRCHQIPLTFDQYVKLGRPSKLVVTLNVEVPSQ